MEKRGFKIERGIGGIETAFRAICTAAVGAGIALMELISELPGRVVVMGTPAEEGGSGKVIMLKNGAFDGVDATMLVHPAVRTMTARGSLATVRMTPGAMPRRTSSSRTAATRFSERRWL